MVYRKKLPRAFEKFEASLNKLTESLTPAFEKEYRHDVLIEIVTKRFEYTFESLWKTLKEVLLTEGIESASPLSSFKEAYSLGLIDKKYEEIFPLMVKKRNEIVHIYSDEDAEEVYLLIKNTFAAAIGDVFRKIKKWSG